MRLIDKKATRLATVAAIALVAVLSVGLAVNRSGEAGDNNMNNTYQIPDKDGD